MTTNPGAPQMRLLVGSTNTPPSDQVSQNRRNGSKSAERMSQKYRNPTIRQNNSAESRKPTFRQNIFVHSAKFSRRNGGGGGLRLWCGVHPSSHCVLGTPRPSRGQCNFCKGIFASFLVPTTLDVRPPSPLPHFLKPDPRASPAHPEVPANMFPAPPWHATPLYAGTRYHSPVPSINFGVCLVAMDQVRGAQADGCL